MQVRKNGKELVNMFRFFRLLLRPAFGFAIFGIDDMAFATMASGALNFGGNLLGGMMASKGI